MDDLHFCVLCQIVQRRHHVPAVHLSLIDLLGSVVEAACVTQADGVGRRKQTEPRMRAQDAVLVEERESAVDFQHPLDHEHDVGSTGIVLIEYQRRRRLQRPWQHAFPELGDLVAVTDHDGVPADEIDPADVAVEVDPDAAPVQAGGHLLDMSRLARAVIALDQHPAVIAKTCKDGESRLGIKPVRVVDLRNMLIRLRVRGDLEVGIDSEDVSNRDDGIGYRGSNGFGASWNIRHVCVFDFEESAARSGLAVVTGKNGIRRINSDQPVRRPCVAAVGVRMVRLHERLIARLDGLQRRFLAKTEHAERARHARVRPRAAGGALTLPWLAALAKQTEPVRQPRLRPPHMLSERPGRTLPANVVTNLSADLHLIAAFEIVPASVVLADMGQTKPAPIAKRLTRPRRRVLSEVGASGVFAHARRHAGIVAQAFGRSARRIAARATSSHGRIMVAQIDSGKGLPSERSVPAPERLR